MKYKKGQVLQGMPPFRRFTIRVDDTGNGWYTVGLQKLSQEVVETFYMSCCEDDANIAEDGKDTICRSCREHSESVRCIVCGTSWGSSCCGQ